MDDELAGTKRFDSAFDGMIILLNIIYFRRLRAAAYF
jgi:hypothetical protein